MDNRHAFAKALKTIRKAKGLTQEDFSDLSSRTYVSMLERCLRTPTLEKIDELAHILGVRPLTLLTLAYYYQTNTQSPKRLMDAVSKELQGILDT